MHPEGLLLGLLQLLVEEALGVLQQLQKFLVLHLQLLHLLEKLGRRWGRGGREDSLVVVRGLGGGGLRTGDRLFRKGEYNV